MPCVFLCALLTLLLVIYCEMAYLTYLLYVKNIQITVFDRSYIFFPIVILKFPQLSLSILERFLGSQRASCNSQLAPTTYLRQNPLDSRMQERNLIDPLNFRLSLESAIQAENFSPQKLILQLLPLVKTLSLLMSQVTPISQISQCS